MNPLRTHKVRAIKVKVRLVWRVESFSQLGEIMPARIFPPSLLCGGGGAADKTFCKIHRSSWCAYTDIYIRVVAEANVFEDFI